MNEVKGGDTLTRDFLPVKPERLSENNKTGLGSFAVPPLSR
jgi:hypothetical protein